MNVKKKSIKSEKKPLPTQGSLPGIPLQGWVVFIFGVLLYANTFSHQFTQDDAIVIYDNMFTTQGVKGIPDLFTKDTFHGFFKESKSNLVSGGRYRPLTPAMFALEYQFVGNQPWLGHLLNMLLYGFLCWMVFRLLRLMICNSDDSQRNQLLVLIAALLFAAHPLHTEAVANIKGRDEIMSMFGSIAAAYFVLKYVDSKKVSALVYACLSLFIGLLAKENAITFLAVIPLILYYFRDFNLKRSTSSTLVLLAPTILFLIIRSAVIGSSFGSTPMELMNNPYLKIVNGSYVPFDLGEKFATIIYTLGKYVQLLVFPHPLTHDYYPRQIDIMSFSDPGVIMSLLVYAGLIFMAIKGFKSRTIFSFAAAYYLITLSIVSNIVFPIGTNMSERFMFMPSLGFALGLSYVLNRWVFQKFGKTALWIIAGLILSLYTFKTVTRNQVWVDNFTLFTTDVKTSQNSAKVLNAAGGTLTDKAATEPDETKKKQMLEQAVVYLNRAIQIHPTYKNAYLILGNAYFYLKDYEKAAQNYDNVLKINPDDADGFKNKALALREAGKYAGETLNDLIKAETYLNQSYQMKKDDAETLRLLGVLNGIKGDHALAVEYFSKVVEMQSDNAGAYLNLSSALRNVGRMDEAESNLKKAMELDPDIVNKIKN